MIYESIAGNARFLMVRLCESSVDDHQFTASLDRALALCHMHRNVSVDYVAVLARYAECIHYAVNSLLVIAQTEEVALFLYVRLFLADEVSLKGCHLRFVEQRRVLSAP